MKKKEVADKVNDSGDRLINKKEVCKWLSLSERSVERLVASGKLAKVRVMGAVRFRFSEVMKIVDGGAV